MRKKISRIGVYALIERKNRLLLVIQKSGPFKGRFDFPGGGIEFGETVEEALKRELAEEVQLDFEKMEWVCNLTSVYPAENYDFYQIGLIYKVKKTKSLSYSHADKHISEWIDPKSLTRKTTSPLLWKYLYH